MSETMIFKVDGMGCQGCVSAVEKAIKSAAPEAIAEISLADGLVRIRNCSADRDSLAAAIVGAGYDVISG